MGAVTVTAELPAFTKEGNRIDVTVSSIGDAEGLKGGTLLFARLHAADGNVYATAQGKIVVTVPAGQRARNLPPTGKIPGGGLIVRSLEADLDNLESISIRLNHPDFNTTSLIAKKINETFWNGIAEPVDLGTVSVEFRRLTAKGSSTSSRLSAISAFSLMPEQQSLSTKRQARL